ncbi:MAG: hypothetical protein ACTHJW_20340 [Streptosporangiaceae bacterium]
MIATCDGSGSVRIGHDVIMNADHPHPGNFRIAAHLAKGQLVRHV